MNDMSPAVAELKERTLLIVDDDPPFLRRLARAMERRGFEVQTAESAAGGVAAARTKPAYAVVDLRLGDEPPGLETSSVKASTSSPSGHMVFLSLSLGPRGRALTACRQPVGADAR